MSKKFQTVGSLLRPEKLLYFKNQIEHSGNITYPFYENFEGYEECEIEATKDVIRKEIEHGLEIITDGEFSRSLWHLDFVWGLKGVIRYIAEHGYFFRDKDQTKKYETRKDIGLRITSELCGKSHHFIKIFKRLKSLAGSRQIKFCVPSPSHIYGELSWSDNIGGKDSVYATPQELKTGLIRCEGSIPRPLGAEPRYGP
jgi:methionine synthase II (cobalamin-independent)